jgi:hypothetical protein
MQPPKIAGTPGFGKTFDAAPKLRVGKSRTPPAGPLGTQVACGLERLNEPRKPTVVPNQPNTCTQGTP